MLINTLTKFIDGINRAKDTVKTGVKDYVNKKPSQKNGDETRAFLKQLSAGIGMPDLQRSKPTPPYFVQA